MPDWLINISMMILQLFSAIYYTLQNTHKTFFKNKYAYEDIALEISIERFNSIERNTGRRETVQCHCGKQIVSDGFNIIILLVLGFREQQT